MKVLIEITDDEYKGIVQNNPKNFIPIDYCEVIRNGTPLNGTNGEVLKAVFPNVVIVEDTEYDCIFISNDFWNADCKKKGGGEVMYGSILVNGIEVICYPNNDGGFWYFHPATREIIEVEG